MNNNQIWQTMFSIKKPAECEPVSPGFRTNHQDCRSTGSFEDFSVLQSIEAKKNLHHRSERGCRYLIFISADIVCDFEINNFDRRTTNCSYKGYNFNC